MQNYSLFGGQIFKAMSLREYYCRKCGKQFDFLERGNRKPQCPCGSRKLAEVQSVPAHIRGISYEKGIKK